MPQANLLFLAGLLEQVAMPFLLPGNRANSFSRKFQESFPFMIRVQRKVGTTVKGCFLIKANRVRTLLLALLSMTSGLCRELSLHASLFPPTWQNPSESQPPVGQPSNSAGSFWLPTVANRWQGALGCHTIVQHLCHPRDGSLLCKEIGFHCWADDTRTCLIVNPANPGGLQGWDDKWAGGCDSSHLDASVSFHPHPQEKLKSS